MPQNRVGSRYELQNHPSHPSRFPVTDRSKSNRGGSKQSSASSCSSASSGSASIGVGGAGAGNPHPRSLSQPRHDPFLDISHQRQADYFEKLKQKQAQDKAAAAGGGVGDMRRYPMCINSGIWDPRYDSK